MKATLKHVDNQYILIAIQDTKTLDTPLILGKWYLTLQHGIKTKTWDLRQYTTPNPLLQANLVSGVYEVIAAENLDGVKGIRIEYNNHLLKSKQSRIREMLDGKEVQVTECKDYWLVRL